MTGRACGGSALVPVVGMLGLLALVGSMSLLAGGADLLLATRAARDRAAVLAAEGALAAALEEIAAEGAVPEEAFASTAAVSDLGERAWRDGGWQCRRRLRSLADAADADADPATGVVLYDRSFGYPAAPRGRGGFPVFQVVATAADGEARGAAVAEVTPVACAPEVAAAWTAAGPLELAGDVLVSGVPEDGSGGAAVPAILAPGPVDLSEGATAVGRVGEDGRAVSVDPLLAQPEDPLDLLRAGATLGTLDELPEPLADGTLRGVVWSRGDWTGTLDGEGVLVVHNPLFDAARHEASRLAVEDGVLTDAWDAAYSHLDPARQPAQLRPAGGEYRGVVVADAVAAPDGAATIVGGLVTLTRSPLSVASPLPLAVRYSPAALRACGRGPLRHVTARRVLPGREAP